MKIARFYFIFAEAVALLASEALAGPTGEKDGNLNKAKKLLSSLFSNATSSLADTVAYRYAVTDLNPSFVTPPVFRVVLITTVVTN
eukprot:scaffold57759_cov50-Attheya_sp.AAC.1